ncbi:hypothetical protein NY547_09210 [Cnuibacter physcomitrellae]|uniref:hypothetical protein n=1 Tax=Cnuibacter physcomitrellae TaxID=1619308 RepID=UPI002175F7F2|nr:hypothetical protein [Cnuibacter physcomitrellae]MCS5497413.1 hypothetical protein [Cnuibacter physcomitrellae]
MPTDSAHGAPTPPRGSASSGPFGGLTRAAVAGRQRERYVPAEAIYGLVLFLAVVASDDGTITDRELLVKGVAASVVVWIAHVLALVVARHGARDGAVTGLRTALRRALSHSAGILVGPTVPILVLVLGAANVLDDTLAYLLTLVSGIAILGLLGLIAYIERRSPWYVCVGGTLLTMVVGVLTVTLKAAFL